MKITNLQEEYQLASPGLVAVETSWIPQHATLGATVPSSGCVGDLAPLRVCVCCGRTAPASSFGCFKNGTSKKSCSGCRATSRASYNRVKHTNRCILYHRWLQMKRRCEDPRSKDHRYYSSVRVCPSWQTFGRFERWALRHGFEPALTIDRTNPSGNYSPRNCRLVDRRTQSRNRRCNLKASAFGTTKLLVEWAEDERARVGLQTFKYRLGRGYDVETALTTPPGQLARLPRRPASCPGASAHLPSSSTTAGSSSLIAYGGSGLTRERGGNGSTCLASHEWGPGRAS